MVIACFHRAQWYPMMNNDRWSTEDVGAFEFPTPPARETLELALEAPGLRNRRGLFTENGHVNGGKTGKMMMNHGIIMGKLGFTV